MTTTPWRAYAACGAVWAALALAVMPGGLLLRPQNSLLIVVGAIPIGMLVGKLTQLMRRDGDRRLWVSLVALGLSVALFGALVGLAMVTVLGGSLPIVQVALGAAFAVALGSVGAVVYVAASGLVFVLWILAYATCWLLDQVEGHLQR